MKSRILLPILLIALAALLVGGCGRAPLVPDAPRGSASWLPNIVLACTTSTTDASGAQVSYQFDWGDGNKSQWSQFMNGGVAFADTHSYANVGLYKIKARAKNSKKASAWSDPLNVNIVAEGRVVWYVGFTDPEDPEDSAEFSINSFALGPNNTAYVTSSYLGAVIACNPSGGVAWRFTTPDLDEFTAAPVVADDGTILVGCSNDFVYALNPDGTLKWADSVGAQVLATGAIGADGTSYFQTADTSVVALRPDGTQSWSFFTEGGNAAPVVGIDGTVYAANQNGTVYAIDALTGLQKWTSSVVGKAVAAPPAIDPTRSVLYATDNETGVLQTIRLADGTGSSYYALGSDASGPVIGPDGSVYAAGNGRLMKLSPELESTWAFIPSMAGILSTPAITVDGYVYVLVVTGKKGFASLQDGDSLYAVNPDGTRRWACGLGEGLSDPEYALSAPRVGANGFIYIGDGYRAWCVAGVSAPAQSVWPMMNHDAQNTGRAR